jgi:hypothetical protein
MDSKGNAKILQIANHKSYTFWWTFFSCINCSCSQRQQTCKVGNWKIPSNHPTGYTVINPRWAYNSGIIFVSEVPKTRFNHTTRSPRKTEERSIPGCRPRLYWMHSCFLRSTCVEAGTAHAIVLGLRPNLSQKVTFIAGKKIVANQNYDYW